MSGIFAAHDPGNLVGGALGITTKENAGDPMWLGYKPKIEDAKPTGVDPNHKPKPKSIYPASTALGA